MPGLAEVEFHLDPEGGGRPLLEICIKEMISAPPFDQAAGRERFATRLRALGIKRLKSDDILMVRDAAVAASGPRSVHSRPPPLTGPDRHLDLLALPLPSPLRRRISLVTIRPADHQHVSPEFGCLPQAAQPTHPAS